MNVAFYNPYHHSFGGGELYLFSMMKSLLGDHQVVYFCDDVKIQNKVKDFFGIDISGVTILPPLASLSRLKSITLLSSFDDVFWYSDGSIPLTLKKNLHLIFQFPVPWVHPGIGEQIKFRSVKTIIVNSAFTKTFIDKTFSVDAKIVHPCMLASTHFIEKKKNIILSVGRFTQAMNTKRQDVLIDAFISLLKGGVSGWKLILAGGVSDGDKQFVDVLTQKAKGFPITFVVSPNREDMNKLYQDASIYWHASGFGIDSQIHPEQVEHFGIATVEAMANSCIPIVYQAGGQIEIVTHGLNGFHWQTKQQLCDLTLKVMESQKQLHTLRKEAFLRAQNFTFSAFTERFRSVIGISSTT